MSPKRFNLASIDWVSVALFVTLASCIGFCLYGVIADPPR